MSAAQGSGLDLELAAASAAGEAGGGVEDLVAQEIGLGPTRASSTSRKPNFSARACASSSYSGTAVSRSETNTRARTLLTLGMPANSAAAATPPASGHAGGTARQLNRRANPRGALTPQPPTSCPAHASRLLEAVSGRREAICGIPAGRPRRSPGRCPQATVRTPPPARRAGTPARCHSYSEHPR
jgi:hypothetical protein